MILPRASTHLNPALEGFAEKERFKTGIKE